MDANVSVNIGCQTAYLTEIALGAMGSVNDTLAETVRSEEMNAARQDLMQEMAARAESIGPAGHPVRASEQTPADMAEQTQDADDGGTLNAMHQDGQSAAPPSGKGGQNGGDGQHRMDGEVGVATRTSLGVKDEHCIDDMYC